MERKKRTDYPYVRRSTRDLRYFIVIGDHPKQNKHVLLEDEDGFPIVFKTQEKAQSFLDIKYNSYVGNITDMP